MRVTLFLGAVLSLVAYIVVSSLPAGIPHESDTGPLKVESKLPVLARVPSFSLTNQDGKIVSESDISGKVVVMNFFFTSCKGICPTVSGNVRSLLREFEGRNDLIAVSVSVDPERDTLEALSAYQARMKGPAFWSFARTKEAQVRELMEGLLIASKKDKELHSTRVVLIDKEGNVRAYARGLERDSVMALQESVTELLQQ